MTNFNSRNSQEQKDKTELANKIAKQSKRVASTYEHVGGFLFKIFRVFSSWIDHVIFNNKYGNVVSLAIAILLFLVVNFDSENALFDKPLQSSKNINNVPVSALYNSDVFELSGLPEKANITITGDGANVTSAANTGGYVLANLEGLTEGTHQVKLTTEGYSGNVSIKVDPSDTVVTLKRKTTKEFDIQYDFINLDKMNSIYSCGEPVFEYSKVNVRASQDKLDSITFVKALIDVTGVTGDFAQQAKLVAYDNNGQPVKCDIVPSEVTVEVPVSNPNKTVPIEVELTGTLPENIAINTLELDQKSTTIYAPDSVLSKIDKVVVGLDVSSITQDATLVRPVTLPTGVNSSNVSQVTLNVTVGEVVSKVIDNVTINFKNNDNNYKFTPTNGKTTTSVTVSGTQDNVDKVTAGDIYVSFDMSESIPGTQEVNLAVEQPKGSLVSYKLNEPTYEINVLGEKVDESPSTSEVE